MVAALAATQAVLAEFLCKFLPERAASLGLCPTLQLKAQWAVPVAMEESMYPNPLIMGLFNPIGRTPFQINIIVGFQLRV